NAPALRSGPATGSRAHLIALIGVFTESLPERYDWLRWRFIKSRTINCPSLGDLHWRTARRPPMWEKEKTGHAPRAHGAAFGEYDEGTQAWESSEQSAERSACRRV